MEIIKSPDKTAGQKNFETKVYDLIHGLKNKLSFYPAACIAGFDLEAWALRDKFLEKYTFAVATSLAGIDNERAWDMRKKIEEMAGRSNDQHIYKGLAQSLSPYMLAAYKRKLSDDLL